MDADLAHAANTLAIVTNDPTAANNTTYIKLGASGAGSWQACATSPQAVLRAYLDSLLDPTYSSRSGYAWAIIGQGDGLAIGVRNDGRVIFGHGGDIATRIDAIESGPLGTIDVTSAGPRSGYAWGVQDQAGALAIGIDTAGNFLVKGRKIADAIADATAALSASVTAATNTNSKWITPTGFWAVGDSLTAGAGGTAYPTQLATLLGKPVTNMGVGGQISTQIAGRFGGVVPLVTVQGNIIPASGAVNVTSMTSTLHNNQGPGSVTGSIGGITGVLTATAFDGNGNPTATTFTRSVAGTATAVDANTPFIISTSDARDFGTAVLWLGRNNFSSGAQVKADIQACVEFLKTQDRRFVVLSVLNGSGENVGTANYNAITTLNNDLKALYPRNYIDVRAALVRAYDSSQTQDVTDFGNDVPPTSLRSDGIHLNTAGYGIVANAVYNFLNLKGWLS
jgi:lysophospholipase L1-like esterase